MKRTIIFITALICSIVANAQEAKDLYNKYSGEKGISAVYISPAMFKLIGALPGLEVDGKGGEKININPLIKSLSGFYLLSTEDSALADKIASDMGKYTKSGKYELLMEAKENGDAVRIYAFSKNDIITSLVMNAKDTTSATFICLQGTINRKDLEELITKVAK